MAYFRLLQSQGSTSLENSGLNLSEVQKDRINVQDAASYIGWHNCPNHTRQMLQGKLFQIDIHEMVDTAATPLKNAVNHRPERIRDGGTYRQDSKRNP